ncbi:hypothetical protein [uncultured Duncaniella sp.]|uniref:hypothetical protein n=1 Tax=uncultured Duncaniella sp. TaxID=2768039 RepID=UPI0025A9F7CC|nr:hypothetical protein [uncultured Duncaniella sp.]
MEKVNNTPKVFNGDLTEAQVEAFKTQHRKSFAVEIQDGDEVHIGYFKRPTLETLKAVTKVAKSDEVEAGKVMFDNCWLGGSKELRTDALLFMAVQKKLGEVLNGFQGLIKNL